MKHRVPSECYWRTGGWSRGHQAPGDDNKLVSGSSLSGSLQENTSGGAQLSSGSPSHCIRRWQQTGEGLPGASVKYDCPSWLDNDPGNDTQAVEETGRGRGVMAGPGGQHVKLGCYKWFLRITISSSWAWIRASHIATLRPRQDNGQDYGPGLLFKLISSL